MHEEIFESHRRCGGTSLWQGRQGLKSPLRKGDGPQGQGDLRHCEERSDAAISPEILILWQFSVALRENVFPVFPLAFLCFLCSSV